MTEAQAHATDGTKKPRNAADRRVRVRTEKTVDLAALDRDLGGHGLAAGPAESGAGVEVVAVEGSPVTAGQLQAAIDAHVAKAPVSREERITAIVDGAKDGKDALKKLVAAGLL